MFERNLAILAGKGQEIEVVTAADDRHIGFAAGLDNEYLQICASDGQRMHLINREFIVQVTGTGRFMSDLSVAAEGLVRANCSHFQSVAAKHTHNQQTRT